MVEKEAQNTESLGETVPEETRDEFLKTIDEMEVNQPEVGELISGTVVLVGSENVFINIGYKSDGKVALDEFEEPPQVGDEVDVVLQSRDARSGGVPVSKRKADERVFWKELKQAFQDHTPVDGKVTRSVKGGFEVQIHSGVRGFNPISKMDTHRIENPDEYVGLESKFYVERLYSENRVNIILSRRAWLEEEVQRKREEFFKSVDIGDEVTGVVKTFTSFGAFIDLGGFDGLLHINDMSWGHVTRPKDIVKKGEELTLKVIRMEPEDQKVNLSLRHMTPDPWESFEDKYRIDDVVPGRVTKLADFGAFIELEEGIEGLAHISELSWVKRINHPKEVLKPGDEVETKILDYDLAQGRVSLGLKQVLPNPWESMAEQYPAGTQFVRPVKKITNSGAFIELEEGIDAFLHIDDLSWANRPRNVSDVLTEGEDVEVVVLWVDPENRNIRVGVKQLSEDPWTTLKQVSQRREIIEGEVTNITDFGLFLRVYGGIEGLLHKNNLTDPRVEPYEQAVKNISVGDKINVVITEINAAKQRLSLSVRELERKEQREEMQKYIHDSGDEDTFTLGEFLKDKGEV